MRVLLLGGTGNLGLRCIAALLVHHHTVVVYVRNIPKLKSLLPPTILAVVTIVKGDATDSAGIRKTIIENECDAIVDTAGNQVWPWQDFLLPKICRAVATAAVEVGEERGAPLRSWFIGGLGLLRYPGTDYLLQD